MKLMKKVSPSEKSFGEFEMVIRNCEEVFKRQVEGLAGKQELLELIEELINNQDPDGYWRLIYSEDMPFDAKMEYWKYPTILFSSIIIYMQVNNPEMCYKISGFNDSLIRALDILERGKLVGHGFDSLVLSLTL